MFTEKKQTLPMNPQQQQVDKLKEIGSQMRQVREEKSVSIDEVATKTRIQARLLIAIEEGNIEHLPEPVYVQGLIKQFAESLGLNGAEYASEFPTGKQTYTIEPSWRQLPAAQLRPLHLYLFYILLVIASVSGLSYLIEQGSDQEKNEQTATQEQVVEEPVATTSPDPEPQLASANSPSSAATQEHPVEVEVSIEKEAWVRVTSDGKQIYEGILAAGEKQNWTAQKELTLRTGNAGGIVVKYNQQSPTVLGDSGEVKQVTYAAPTN